GFGQDCSGSAQPAVEMWGNGAEAGVFEALPVVPRDAETAAREGERAGFRASAMASDGPGRIWVGGTEDLVDTKRSGGCLEYRRGARADLAAVGRGARAGGVTAAHGG